LEWLSRAKKCESPNFDDRPENTQVDMLVIHSISLPPAEYGNDYVEQLFQNSLDPGEHKYFEEISDLKVSAHFFIKRDGQIIQFVSLDKRAWHAGVSSWQGQEKCNDFSIGIELEGCDEEEYTDFQYSSLTDLTKQIQSHFPKIAKERIVGHSDIAPGRKTDPGPRFDWERFLGAL